MTERIFLTAAAVIVGVTTAATLLWIYITFPFMQDMAPAWGIPGMLLAMLAMSAITQSSGAGRRSRVR
ncbi:hypothetical protein [Arthrobacter sp. efr-133-R2A-63]|uniref:hypothetical protein n=1 Tax=Arthrobacter sp. efr-133-R2A-63 TaxID=3040278 RepID=UPI002551993B|nr:hypothetical protein [Arthrobacter sp. efr-133-R2A-63]